MPNVLILGARAPVALELARRFAARQWHVYAADSLPCRAMAWSRAVRKIAQVASPRFAPERFLDDLNTLIREYGIDLIVPTCEETFYLARHRNDLPRQVQILVDDFEQLHALHSKWRFLELAQSAKVPTPASMLVRNLEEARKWAEAGPVVLKPEYSRFGAHVRCYTEGIPADAPALENQGAWVAQRYCTGREMCSYGIAERGCLLAHAVYFARYRLVGRAGYYFEPCVSDAIEAAVRRLVARLNYSGQISFDWIVDDEGGIRAIECNPRATSGVHVFAENENPVDAMSGIPITVAPIGSRQPRMIAALMLALGWPLARRLGIQSLWREDFRRARDVLMEPGDRWPFFGGIIDWMGFMRSAQRHRIDLYAASTYDIEWNGDAAA
ncbi:MAG: ATP-grasp domain-containing protein [Xanthomonadaceae bacterium]|jgi:hypothetical protein|nr:ATP-grasp domain-containing protein [Xanthomonadaceae bacterium]